MARHFLITRPSHDKETSYLHSFSKAIVVETKEDSNIQVTDLEGGKATRNNLERAFRANQLVFLNGHGDEKSVWGHKDEVILDKKNVRLTKDNIVYALACNSLIKLGEIAIKEGAKAYIGYEAEFMYVGDPAKSSVPDKDRNAAPFRCICHHLIHYLVYGTQVGEAVQKTKEEYMKLIRRYGTSEDDPFGDAPLIGFALSWNLACLGMRGDPCAVF